MMYVEGDFRVTRTAVEGSTQPVDQWLIQHRTLGDTHTRELQCAASPEERLLS